MDWQTLVSRRAKKDPLATRVAGAPSSPRWGSLDVLNPVSTAFLNASCDKATFGWTCDAETFEKLRDAYAAETDPAKQKAIAEQVQLRAAGVPDPRAARPVPDADGARPQRQRPAALAGAGAVERGEEVGRVASCHPERSAKGRVVEGSRADCKRRWGRFASLRTGRSFSPA